jgi:hypothetical protein
MIDTHVSAGRLELFSPELLRHQDFVVVATALLERVQLDSIVQEPETRIEPPRRLVFFDHAELDQFDMPAGKIDDGFDQPPTRLAFGRTYMPTSIPLWALLSPAWMMSAAMPMSSTAWNAPSTKELPSRSANQLAGLTLSAAKLLPKASGLHRSDSSLMSRNISTSPAAKRRI